MRNIFFSNTPPVMNDNTTTDTFFNGQLKVRQNRQGYRFSIDAVILANQARPKPGERILDLGSGCGIIPLIVAFRYPANLVYGVEVQQDLADLAHLNVRHNQMEDRVQIFHQDMKTITQAQFSGSMDMVLSNPPYWRADSGRINPHAQRAVARHEIKVVLLDVLKVANAMLKTSGRFVAIYPSERLADLLISMRDCRLEPKILRFIHSKCDSDAKLMIVEAIKKGNPGLRVYPSLIIYRSDGTYTEEVASMFEP